MSNFRRETAHLTAEQTVSRLLDRGVTLPTEVSDAIDALRAHVDRGAPQPVTSTDLSDAYLDAMPDKALDVLATQHAAVAAKSAAYTDATRRFGLRVLNALTGNGDNLTQQLAKLAADRIANLERVAELSTLDVGGLLRNGDTEGADLAAHADHVAGDLADLYSLRKAVTHGAEYGIGNVNCAIYRDPRLMEKAEAQGLVRPTATNLDRYLVALRVGAGLWFPTPGEAEAAARAIVAGERAASTAAEAENFKRGQRFASR